MDKNKVKLGIDILMLLDFIAVIISGFARMNDLHYSSSILLIVLVLAHLLFNLNWIKGMIKNMFFKK